MHGTYVKKISTYARRKNIISATNARLRDKRALAIGHHHRSPPVQHNDRLEREARRSISFRELTRRLSLENSRKCAERTRGEKGRRLKERTETRFWGRGKRPDLASFLHNERAGMGKLAKITDPTKEYFK